MLQIKNQQGIVRLPRRLRDYVPVIESDSVQRAEVPQPNTWGLIERISTLPGVRAEHSLDAGNAPITDCLIEPDYVPGLAATSPQLLCRIECKGILLPNMSPLDREKVAQKRWALSPDDTLLYLPRDSIEMEIEWRIVLYAYQFMTALPARAHSIRKKWPVATIQSATMSYCL